MRPRTAELLFLLLEPARPVREKALIQLATQGDPDALEELVRFAAAAGPIGNERALAFRAIAASVRPPAPEVRRLLLAHRNDGDPFVRAAALDGLVRFADERLEPVFREGVADPELLVRQAAHEALRLLAEDPGAVPGAPAASFPAADPRPADRPVQAALLLDTAPLRGGEPVSGVAAGGSGSRQREAQRVRSLLDRLMPGGQGSLEEVTQQLAGLGSSACGPLLAELRCPTVLQRMAVAQALGRLGDRRVLDPLVARLKGPEAERDAQVVAVLLRALGSMLRPGDLQHLDLLLEHARASRAGRSNDLFVRAAALDALARLPTGRSVAALLAAMDDPEPWLQETAARGLAAATPAPAPELVPTLAEMLLRATRPEVLVGLLLALRRAYPPGGSFPSLRPRLSELMAHAEPSVREAAILACDALLAPTGTSPPPLDDSLLTRLAERVADPSPEVRRTALELLADVAPPGYAPAAAPVRELARSADAAIARPALRVLGRVGDLASVETMIEVAQGSQLALAREAIRLLEQLQGPVKVERTAEGGFVPVLALSCGCGERPVWRTDALGREMLVCPGCRTSFLLTASGALAPVTALPYGICRCCRRPAPLEQSEGGLRCPTTGDVHLRHPASGATYRASSLPHGGCGCCAPPVPLFEAAGRVYCPQSGRAHQPTPQLGYAPVPAPGQEGRPAGPAATHPTVAEVNRALLEGSLMLTQSGLPVIGDGEE